MHLRKHPRDNGCSYHHPLSVHVDQARGVQVLHMTSFALGYSGTPDLTEEELELYRRT